MNIFLSCLEWEAECQRHFGESIDYSACITEMWYKFQHYTKLLEFLISLEHPLYSVTITITISEWCRWWGVRRGGWPPPIKKYWGENIFSPLQSFSLYIRYKNHPCTRDTVSYTSIHYVIAAKSNNCHSYRQWHFIFCNYDSYWIFQHCYIIINR